MALNKDIDITQLPIGDLRPDLANPRRISDEELESLTRAIREFGFVDPIIARMEDKVVIGGHQRLIAARKLGLKQVPVVLLDLTEDQARIQASLMKLGVRIETDTVLQSIGADKVVLECGYTERTRELDAATVVMVTSREPRDALYHSLYERIDITRIGDCGAPGIIASAVHSGHRYAREMDTELSGIGFRRETSASSDL